MATAAHPLHHFSGQGKKRLRPLRNRVSPARGEFTPTLAPSIAGLLPPDTPILAGLPALMLLSPGSGGLDQGAGSSVRPQPTFGDIAENLVPIRHFRRTRLTHPNGGVRGFASPQQPFRCGSSRPASASPRGRLGQPARRHSCIGHSVRNARSAASGGATDPGCRE